MKDCLYILTKYWSKHKKSLTALLFSGVLLCAVVTGTFLQVRANFNRALHETYDDEGMYEVILIDVPDELIAELTARKTPEKEETIQVLEDKALLYGWAQTCGYADGSVEMMHIPFESGRLPEAADEVAITRATANEIGWSGRTGDTILMNGERYTVSGIIGEKYDNRHFSEHLHFAGDDAYRTDAPIPSVYISKPAEAEIAYSIKMFSGVTEVSSEPITSADEENADEEGSAEDENTMICFGLGWIDFLDKIAAAFDNNGMKASQHFTVNDLNSYAHMTAESDQFKATVRWFTLIAAIAAVVAVLSVFAVLRLIFAERENSFAMLRRIGLSKRRLRSMYAIECLLVTCIQLVIGTVLGALGYIGIHAFEVRTLGLTDYSAFTSDVLVNSNTRDPFVMGIVVGGIVMPLGYALSVILGRERKRFGRRRRARKTVFGNIGAVLGSRGITVIQTLALALIMFGSMLGYMYFTDNGKDYLKGLAYFPTNDFEIAEGLNMQEEGISEYYKCMPQIVMSSASEFYGLPFSEPGYSGGLTDSDIEKLGNVTATADMINTFIILDEPIQGGHKGRINFGKNATQVAETQQFILDYSSEDYQDFFDEGNIGSKPLYQINTRLANAAFIESLRDNVIEGEINIDKLNSGEEVIAVLSGDDKMLTLGRELNIGSLLRNDEFGIDGISTGTARIGAIVVTDPEDSALSKHIIEHELGFSLLTTQTGADSLGIYNAVYDKVFSNHHIDAGLIPPSAGMELTSREVIESRAFREKATKLGGLFFLIGVMFLLGFAAYFNGIGMKVRLKEYQISVLRAIGASKRQMRLRLFINNIKVPIFSAVLAGGGMLYVQRFFLSMYEKMVTYFDMSSDASISLTDTEYEQLNNTVREMTDKYFLNSELWMPNMIKPLIVIFAAVTVITLVLMLMNMKRFDSCIAESISKGRKRK